MGYEVDTNSESRGTLMNYVLESTPNVFIGIYWYVEYRDPYDE